MIDYMKDVAQIAVRIVFACAMTAMLVLSVYLGIRWLVGTL